MHGTQKSAVAANFANLCGVLNHFRTGNISHYLFSEYACCLLQICLDSGVIIGVFRMGTMGVSNADTVPHLWEVYVKLLYIRRCGIFEIDMANAAHCDGHLIHETARFSVITVLRILRNMR